MKISKKIVAYTVKRTPESKDRPETITGRTYKIKPGDHAYYITINNMNDRPYEVFINSKDLQNFQWIMIFTRLVSAVLRKGGEYEFMIDEMKTVVDPAGGGYWKKGVRIESLIAEIGMVLEQHLTHFR